MPDPYSCKNLLLILVTIYIQKTGVYHHTHGSGKNIYSNAPRKNYLEKNCYIFYVRWFKKGPKYPYVIFRLSSRYFQNQTEY